MVEAVDPPAATRLQECSRRSPDRPGRTCRMVRRWSSSSPGWTRGSPQRHPKSRNRQLEAMRRPSASACRTPEGRFFDTIAAPVRMPQHALPRHERNRTGGSRRYHVPDRLGAQYINGRPTITRTVAIGAVPEEQNRFFTLCSRALIAISTRLPEGVTRRRSRSARPDRTVEGGRRLCARTGHGCRLYLSSTKDRSALPGLPRRNCCRALILSNEPGYYRPVPSASAVENLVVVRQPEGRWRRPADARLRHADLLPDRSPARPSRPADHDELDWLNAYHAETREKLMPLLSNAEDRDWLASATGAIAR